MHNTSSGSIILAFENYFKLKPDKLVKSPFANDIEQFWKKIRNEPAVKNFNLFEGDSPSF